MNKYLFSHKGIFSGNLDMFKGTACSYLVGNTIAFEEQQLTVGESELVVNYKADANSGTYTVLLKKVIIIKLKI